MVRTWKLRIILQRMNITYWIYFKEWAKKTTRKRYVHEKIEFHIVQPVKRKSSSEMKRNKSDMIFLLKGNKIAKKVLSFKDQINIFPYLRYHTWKAHILLHVPPNVTLQCQKMDCSRKIIKLSEENLLQK